MVTRRLIISFVIACVACLLLFWWLNASLTGLFACGETHQVGTTANAALTEAEALGFASITLELEGHDPVDFRPVSGPSGIYIRSLDDDTSGRIHYGGVDGHGGVIVHVWVEGSNVLSCLQYPP